MQNCRLTFQTHIRKTTFCNFLKSLIENCGCESFKILATIRARVWYACVFIFIPILFSYNGFNLFLFFQSQSTWTIQKKSKLLKQSIVQNKDRENTKSLSSFASWVFSLAVYLIILKRLTTLLFSFPFFYKVYMNTLLLKQVRQHLIIVRCCNKKILS